MAASKRGGRTSTFMLVVWGAVMLFVGLGAGLLLSGSGCKRRERPHGESKVAPAQPARNSSQSPKPVAKSAEPAPKPAKQEAKAEPKNEPKTEPRSDAKRDEPVKHEHEPKLPKFALVIDDLGYAPPEL